MTHDVREGILLFKELNSVEASKLAIYIESY